MQFIIHCDLCDIIALVENEAPNVNGACTASLFSKSGNWKYWIATVHVAPVGQTVAILGSTQVHV